MSARIKDSNKEMILNLYSAGMSTTQITRVLPVSASTVQNVVRQAPDVKLAQPWTGASMGAFMKRNV
ncbi:helix-turn-helix DNA-binding domain protein [Rhodococcus phage NiceHouse]|nr:helix-turn-helix DNA-binding domain protein [Rhodococcus phage NiceHouse]